MVNKCRKSTQNWRSYDKFSDHLKILALLLERWKHYGSQQRLMAKTQGFYKVVRASAVTHRKLQISKVVTPPHTRLTYSKGL
jgi:hypothetical protein